jgi:hypothetical protein
VKLKRIARTGICLLLSAIVLIWSTLPGVRHSHPGGNDLKHKHHASVVKNPSQVGHARHSAFHDHGDDSQFRQTVSITHSADNQHSHLHFQWFGFQIAFPDTKIPDQERKGTTSDQLVYLRPMEELIGSSVLKPGFEKPFAAIDCWSSFDLFLVNHSATASFQTISIVFLCDRARHERSGVQLS